MNQSGRLDNGTVTLRDNVYYEYSADSHSGMFVTFNHQTEFVARVGSYGLTFADRGRADIRIGEIVYRKETGGAIVQFELDGDIVSPAERELFLRSIEQQDLALEDN